MMFWVAMETHGEKVAVRSEFQNRVRLDPSLVLPVVVPVRSSDGPYDPGCGAGRWQNRTTASDLLVPICETGSEPTAEPLKPRPQRLKRSQNLKTEREKFWRTAHLDPEQRNRSRCEILGQLCLAVRTEPP